MEYEEWKKMPVGTVIMIGSKGTYLRVKLNDSELLIINDGFPGDIGKTIHIGIDTFHFYDVAPRWIAEKFEVEL